MGIFDRLSGKKKRVEESTAPKSHLPKSVVELYQEGVQHYKSEEYQHAASLFERVIDANPNSTAAHCSLARCYVKLVKGTDEEDYRLSKRFADLYERSLELNESHGGLEESHVIEACFALGTYYQMLRNFSRSIEYFELCLKHDPTDIGALLFLSTSYHFQGDDKASFDNAVKAFHLNSADESVLNQLLSVAGWGGIERVTGLSDEQRANLFHELKTEQDAFFLHDDKVELDMLSAEQEASPRKMSIALAEGGKRSRKAAIESVCYKRNLKEWIVAIVYQEGERKRRESERRGSK